MRRSETNYKYNIALDAMGGDFAPTETVSGALAACSNKDTRILLVGDEDEVMRLLPEKLPTNLTVVPSHGVIHETEHPVDAMKSKPKSSILICATMVKQGLADAYVSMGSTGAAMAAGVVCLGTLPGVERPALGGPFLGLAPNTVLVDLGTGVDNRPSQLVNYGVLGVAFSKIFCDIENPKVGLLSVGSEEVKGNRQTREAHNLLSKSNLNFIGNVEGIDIPKSKADVIVCDGFVGNILMKFTEGLGQAVIEYLGKYLDASKGEASDSLIRELNKLTNFAEHFGGAPLLGLNGICVVGHGRSRSNAIMLAIEMAKTAIEKEFVDVMTKELGKVDLHNLVSDGENRDE